MKINLSLAVVAAVAMAVAASPSEAAGSKKKAAKSGKAAKVTVTKASPYYASSFQACYGSTAGMWFPIAAVGAVGCGIVYAIPVAIEGFVVPQGGGKA